MSLKLHRVAMVALLLGSAILLFSCKPKPVEVEEQLDGVKTEESENLTIVMSENGRKSYIFTTPLLEGYTLGRDPYREFRKGISITTYQDDSLSTVNAKLVANYAIYYEKRRLWEAKGDVVVTKHDGTRVYTQQLFWNSVTKRIYSNVDTKLVSKTDEVIGEGFESDEEMNEPRFRRWKGRMQVDMEQLRKEQKEGGDGQSSSGTQSSSDTKSKSEDKKPQTPAKPTTTSSKPAKPGTAAPSKPTKPGSAMPHPQNSMKRRVPKGEDKSEILKQRIAASKEASSSDGKRNPAQAPKQPLKPTPKKQ